MNRLGCGERGSGERRASVSLCMIVRNEAHQLDECLGPVAALFDEIVIIDTGSSDGTREVAERFTRQVFDFPWCDDFSAARNESLRHSTGDWVFWLDADDRLDAENVSRLGALFNELSDRPAAYLLDTLCLPRDPHDFERLITHARLLRRHPDLQFSGRVHEQVLPAAQALGYQVIAADVQIRHVGYQDRALMQRKLHRDIRLLRMDYAVDPHHPGTLLHLGTTYAQLGNSAEARRYLLQLLDLAQQPHDHLRRAFSTLGELSLWDGQYADAARTMSQALALFPGDDHLAYLLAEALYELDQYQAAQQVLLDIMQRPDTATYSAGAPRHIKQLVAPRSLGEVLRIQRAFGPAEDVLLRVVEHFPQDAIAWHALGRLYIDLARRERLEFVREQVAQCPGGEMFASLLLAAWHMQRSEWKAAETAIDALIAAAPHMPMPRLMRAEVLTRREASLEARLQAYRDILRVSPGHPQAAEMIKRLEGILHRPVTVAPQPTFAMFSLGVETMSQ